MPKRTFAVYPDCGRTIATRQGRIRYHNPTQGKLVGSLCPGSGKTVRAYLKNISM